MVPTPSHMAGWLGPAPCTGIAPCIDAPVRCPCGNERLEFHYPGATGFSCDSEEPVPAVAEIYKPNDVVERHFVIKAVCGVCRAERVVFDRDRHGWEPVTWGWEGVAQAAELPRLFVWRCLACGGPTHRGRVRFFLDSLEDFRDRVEGRVGEERWPDAFHWFNLGLVCCGCGHESPTWVSYECR